MHEKSTERRSDNPADSHQPAKAWPYPPLVAHRCGGTMAPENTLAGLDACLRYGYRMVECDAKLSADNQIYLLHDDTLERTTDGHGAAVGQPWDNLKKLDAGSWYDARFAGEQLPTLADLAARCKRDRIAVNIEIKPCPGRETETGHLVGLATAALWADRDSDLPPPLFSSFSVAALDAARHAAPHLPRGMLFDEVPPDWQQILQKLECVSVHASQRHLTADIVSAAHGAGYRVLAYTVNDPAKAATLREWGVDALCTDRLDLLRSGSD